MSNQVNTGLLWDDAPDPVDGAISAEVEERRTLADGLLSDQRRQNRERQEALVRTGTPQDDEAVRLSGVLGISRRTAADNLDMWQKVEQIHKQPDTRMVAQPMSEVLQSLVGPAVAKHPEDTQKMIDAAGWAYLTEDAELWTDTPAPGFLDEEQRNLDPGELFSPQDPTAPIGTAAEVVVAGLKKGYWQTEVGQYGYRALIEIADGDDWDRIDELRAEIHQIPRLRNEFLGRVLAATSTQVPVLTSISLYSAAGAGSGFLASGLNPAAALTGGSIGAGLGGFALEGGGALLELLNMRDEMIAKGETPPDWETIRGTAIVIGITNGVLEVAGSRVLFQLTGAQHLFAKLSGMTPKQILRSKSLRPYLKSIAGRFSAAVASNGAEEGMQETVNVVLSSYAFGTDPFTIANAERVRGASVEGALGGGGIMTLGVPVVGFLEKRVNDRRVAAGAASTSHLVTVAQKTELGEKMREADPSALVAFLHNMIRRNGRDTDIYVRPEDMREFFQQDDTPTVEELDQVMPGIAAQMEESADTGADVVIPMAEYATYLGEHHESLGPKLRHGVSQRSREEMEAEAVDEDARLEAFLKEREELTEAERAELTEEQDLEELLQRKFAAAGGYRLRDAQMVARMLVAFARQMRDRGGDPQAYQRLRDLILVGPENEPIAGRPPLPLQAKQKLATLFDELRTGAAPEERGLPATPLLTLLRDRGGVKPGSRLAVELRALGVRPGARGVPVGLFRKTGHRDAVDIDLAGEELLVHVPTAVVGAPFGEETYDESTILGLVDAEMRGDPLRTEEQLATRDEERAPREQLGRLLEASGLDVSELSNEELLAQVADLLGGSVDRPIGELLQAVQTDRSEADREAARTLLEGGDLDALVEAADLGQLAAGILSEPEKVAGSKTTEQLGRDLERPGDPLQLVKVRGRFTPATPEQIDAVSNKMVADVVFALSQEGSAVEWYRADIAEMHQTVSRTYPEVGTDATARSVFNLFLAVTSQGVAIPQNMAAALEAYGQYRENPEAGFPLAGTGPYIAEQNKNFELLNLLIETEGGIENVIDMFRQTIRATDIKQAFGLRSMPGEELASEVVPIAIRLGPKIGRFWLNLEGNFGELTADRWFMRTWGRYTGRFFSEGGPKHGPQLLDAPPNGQERRYQRQVVAATIAKLADLGIEADVASIQATLWYPEKEIFAHLGGEREEPTSYSLEAARRLEGGPRAAGIRAERGRGRDVPEHAQEGGPQEATGAAAEEARGAEADARRLVESDSGRSQAAVAQAARGLRTLLQAEPAPQLPLLENERPLGGMFYSKLAQTLRGLSGEPRQAPQLRAALTKAGVKEDEVIWSGLDEFLTEMGERSFTAGEALAAVNLIKVTESVLGEESKGSATLHRNELAGKMIEALTGQYQIVARVGDFEILRGHTAGQMALDNIGDRLFDTHDEAVEARAAYVTAVAGSMDTETLEEGLDFLEVDFRSEGSDVALFAASSLNLPDRGETTGAGYTEIILQLPPMPVDTVQVPSLQELKEAAQRASELYKASEAILMDRRMGRLSQEQFESLYPAAVAEWEAAQEHSEEMERAADGRRAQQWTEGHWSDLDILEDFATIRLDVREDANGVLTLFVQEMQSDRHQRGQQRDEYSKEPLRGYRPNEVTRKAYERRLKVLFEDRKKTIKAVVAAREAGNAKKEAKAMRHWDGLEAERAKLSIWLGETRPDMSPSSQPVPDAPWKNTWHELALKRAIAEAVKRGVKQIAWTTGRQQVERYEGALKMVADKIEWSFGIGFANGVPTKSVRLWKDDHQKLGFVVEADGTVVEASDGASAIPQAIGKPISEIIGKHAAKSIMEADQGEMTGEEGFVIGGHFFQQLYDEKIVKAARKIGALYGAEVGTTQVVTGDPSRLKEGAAADRLTEALLDAAVPAGLIRVIERAWGSRKSTDSWLAVSGPSDGAVYQRLDTEGTLGLGESTGREVALVLVPEAVETYEQAYKLSKEQTVHTLQITDAMGESLTQELFQDPKGKKRGSITFDEELRQVMIAFTEARNLSTGLHEAGHLFFLTMMRAVEMGTADEGMVGDMDTILRWMGVNSAAEITDEHHEMFARYTEAYLREGNAPSAELRSAFQAFTEWLKRIYKSLRQLGVELNPEMNGVMDRILASDEQIAMHQEQARVEQVFADKPELASEQEWAAIQAAWDRVEARATNEIRKKFQRERERELRAQWKADREEVRAQVEAELNQDPATRLRHWLQFGTVLGDPEGVVDTERLRMDRDELVALFGADILEIDPATGRYRLPKGSRYGVWQKNGEKLSVLAEAFGFRDSEGGADPVAMVQAIVATNNRRQEIKRVTDERMQEKFGDILNDGTLPDLVGEALRTDETADALALELLLFERAAGVKGTPQHALRRLARNIIGRQSIRGLRPLRYSRAEERAAVEVVRAVAAEDWGAAHQARQRQLLNHFLVIESQKALTLVEALRDYLRRFGKKATRQRIGKAGKIITRKINDKDEIEMIEGESFLGEIDALLDRFDLREIPASVAAKRNTLAEFILETEARWATADTPSAPFEISKRMQKEIFSVPWRDMEVGAFEELVASVRNLEHQARAQSKLLLDRDRADFEQTRDELYERLLVKPRYQRDEVPKELNTKEKSREWIQDFFAGHRKLGSLLAEFDGELGGPFFDAILRPMDEQSGWEQDMRVLAGKELEQLFARFDTGFGSRLGQQAAKSSFGLLGEAAMNRKEEVEGLGEKLSYRARLMVLLNLGNKGNRQRLQSGYNWDDAQIAAILRTFTRADLEWAQSVWNYFESFRPLIAAKMVRTTGVEADWVDGDSFTVETADGDEVTVDGGYFPIKIDHRQQNARPFSDIAAQAQMQALAGRHTASYTRRGHEKDRALVVEGQKLRLDFGVIFEHVGNVIHDLAWHEWLMDTNRLLRDSKIDQAIRAGYGPSVMRSIQNTLTAIAVGDIPAERGFQEGINWLRTGSSIAAMGWSATTTVLQLSGLTQSMERIGPRWILRGASQWMRGGPAEQETARRFINDRSRIMRNRKRTLNRELRDIQDQIEGGGLFNGHVKDSYFAMIVQMQTVVDTVTWLGAYDKEMEAGSHDEGKAVAMADRAVIDSQGSGTIENLAAVQRGGPMQKLWTNFYTFMNTSFNLTAESWRKRNFRNPADVGRFAGDMMLLYYFPIVLNQMVIDALRQDYDEDEDWDEYLLRQTFSFDVAKDVAAFGMSTVMGGREVAGFVQGYTDYKGPPGTRFFAAAGRLTQQSVQGELDPQFWRAANEAGGIIFHYPANQLRRLADGVLYWDEESFAEFPFAPAVGPPVRNRDR